MEVSVWNTTGGIPAIGDQKNKPGNLVKIVL